MPEKFENTASRMHVTGGLVFGFVLLALGIVFTLDNLGIADADETLRWWPVVPLAYGLWLIAGVGRRPRWLAGTLISAASLWLLFHNLGYIAYDLWDLWPLALIGLGASIVWKAFRGPPAIDVHAPRVAGGDAGAAASTGDAEGSFVDPSPRLSTVAFWSATKTQVVSRGFRGGDVTAVMGGHDIDLRHAQPADGRAVLDVLVVMGGVDVFIPSDWQVSNEAFAVMGSIEDNTRAPAGPARGLLVIRGFVLMGGVEIKN
jgi:hypothetical protein